MVVPVLFVIAEWALSISFRAFSSALPRESASVVPLKIGFTF
jgi:hypothetical protein